MSHPNPLFDPLDGLYELLMVNNQEQKIINKENMYLDDENIQDFGSDAGQEETSEETTEASEGQSDENNGEGEESQD